MPKTKGKFVVIEGIDGCGGETQTKRLSSFFLKRKIDFITINHPDYKTPLGKIIDKHLYSKDDFPFEMQMLLYFIEIFQERSEIEKYLKQGKIVIADRYFTSTLAYQGKTEKQLKKLLDLEKLFPLIKPDLCIFLRISPEVSFKRKTEEKGDNLDRFEKDTSFLRENNRNYAKLAKNNIFCKWETVDGEKSKEEVFNEIISIINKKLRLNWK
jgi:dTMP kinase